MIKKIKLIEAFAEYPEWEYVLDTTKNPHYYEWGVENHRIGVHKDIVDGMPKHFEQIKEYDQIDLIIDEIQLFMEYKWTWQVLLSNPPQYPRYWRNKIREVLEKYTNKYTSYIWTSIVDDIMDEIWGWEDIRTAIENHLFSKL